MLGCVHQGEVPSGPDDRILAATLTKWLWLPTPLFLLTVCSLLLWQVPGSFESLYLLLALNFVFAMLVSLLTAYLAFRAFLISGRPGLMILGCGLLIWGGTTIVATTFARVGPNELVTVHNLGVFLAALCHLTAAVLRRQARAAVNAPGLWLAAGITGTAGITGLVTIAAAAGWTPVFFIPGSGGTHLRQAVLWSSIGMFALTAWFMQREYRRSPSPFLQWYASGLSLIAVGLFGVMLQSIPGSIIGWIGRAAQFLGGAYILVAALAAIRESRVWGLPLDQVLRDTRAKLQDQIERYGLVLAGANAALWDWDVPNKRVVFSPQWKILHGFQEDENIDREEAWRESIHPGDREQVFAALKRHFDGKTAVFSEEYRIVCRDGSVKWIFDRGLAKRDASGRVIRMAGSEIDITERKLGEQALRENERRLSLAISATADAIWEWNLATSQTYYSPRWYEMLGYAINAVPMDFDGWKRLCHPDDFQPTLELIQSSLDADRPGYAAEFRMRSKDGSWIWILGRGRVVEYDEAGKPLLLSGTNTDISERKRAEATLQAALAKAEEGDRMLTALMASVPEGITICDAAGNIRMVSRHGQKMLGRPHADRSIEEVARDWTIYCPDGRTVMPITDLPLMRALKGETVQDVELVQVGDRGEKLPLLCNAAPIRNAAGEILGGIVAWRDISARKAAEEAVRESEARLAAILKQLPVGVGVIDTGGRVLLRNDRMRNYMSGMMPSRDAAQRNRWQAVEDAGKAIPPDQWPGARALGGEKVVPGMEFIHTDEDGREHWLIVSAVPFANLKGDEAGAIVVAQDITALKKSEQALRDANEELNEYAYALVHNVKAPFRAVQNYANFLLEDLGGSLKGDPKQFLEGIQSALRQANQQFNDLDALYRIRRHAAEFEAIDMRALLDEIAAEHRTTHDRQLIVSPEWPILCGERFLISQILTELIRNGFKYNRAELKTVEVGWRQAAGNRLEIYVRDNGIGIDPQYNEHIFHIFKRLHTEKEYEGTGIGLAIVRRAVKTIGGELRIVSALGEGSTFEISIPATMIEDMGT